jgi:hypothetical protein
MVSSRRWLEASERPAIATAVAGAPVATSMFPVIGRYLLVTRRRQPAYCFQLQMPPDLHGQA